MAKRYNLNSKKLYESNSAYVLTVDEYDPNGRRVKDTIEFEDQYQSLDDAIEDTYEIMTNVAEDQGINEDDVVYNENGDTVTFTVENIGKWVFKAIPATNECGDNCTDDNMQESMKPSKKNRTSLKESVCDDTYASKRVRSFVDDVYKEACHEVGRVLANTEIVYCDHIQKGIEEYCPDCHVDEMSLHRRVVFVDHYLFISPYAVEKLLDERDWDSAFDKMVNDMIGAVHAGMERTNECNEDDSEGCKESVATRFARLRKMFESDDDEDNEDNGNDSDDSDSDTDDDNSDDNDADDNDDENEDEEMKAVILTVKKGDADKCKDELIDANIPEEDIEVIEGDEEAENDEIRVDVNSVMELKDYLAKKGIDLEEEIGGEIVSDDSDDDTDTDNAEDGDEGGDEEEFNFDDLGDIFGAEDDEK